MYVWLQHTRRCVCEYIFVQSFWAQREIFRMEFNLCITSMYRGCRHLMWLGSCVLGLHCMHKIDYHNFTHKTAGMNVFQWNSLQCRICIFATPEQYTTKNSRWSTASRLFKLFIHNMMAHLFLGVLLVAGKLFIISFFFSVSRSFLFHLYKY